MLGSVMKTSFLPFVVHLYTLVSPFLQLFSSVLYYFSCLLVFWTRGSEVKGGLFILCEITKDRIGDVIIPTSVLEVEIG